MDQDNAPQAVEPVKQSGFFSRLMGVYFSPGETFNEMAAAPNVLAPIILLLVLTMGTTLVFSTKVSMDQLTEQRTQEMVDSGRITQEQADQQKEQMKKIAPYMKVLTPVIAVITTLIMLFAIAGIIKLVSMMIGTENNYMPLVAVTTYSLLAISIITSIIFIVLIFIKPIEDFDWNNPMGSNVAALLSVIGMEKLPKFLKTFLSYIDVFFIWRLALLAIGTAAVSKKLKTSSAMLWASGVALIMALIHSAWSAIFG